MEHLIANSGIQFITREIEFNPNEPLVLKNGKILRYSFCEYDDFESSSKQFSILTYSEKDGKFIPVDQLLSDLADYDAVLRRPTGREELDVTGLVKINPEYNTNILSLYDASSPEIFSMSSLLSFRVLDPKGSMVKVPAFDLLMDKWLPMPMFYKDIDGVTGSSPYAWCRMKMQLLGEGSKKGANRYRLIWAFDTQTGADELDIFKPYISDESDGSAEYCLCNKVDLLAEFMSSDSIFHSFSDYLMSVLGMNPLKDTSSQYKGFYIYFINYIRLLGASPEITLHDNPKREIFVDLVLDIGNSRTCGILFEEGDFKRGKMLELRDLSRPWLYYENKTYDMRLVFRKADFGNDIVLDETAKDMFCWKSFVRIGEEARRLVYRSLEEEGLSEKTTNYSSPKRYLWDLKPYDGQWENLITTEDPYGVLLANDIYVPTLSELFNKDGQFSEVGFSSTSGIELLDLEKKEHHYSRSSLMTFAMIELFQHAINQINSIRYRNKWGNIDCRRFIRNVIVTCPTAMPLAEQIKLRDCASDAYTAITKVTRNLRMAEIIPSSEALKITNQYAGINRRVWSYDEASCCQLVYLYAEISQRYSGEISKFFELKGHFRPELAEEGYTNKALTIGSIDIGAGTTDIMVCSYEYDGDSRSVITPIPLFWDSFYLAGDDILRNLIQNIVIEGKDLKQPNEGNITSALTVRLLAKSDEELQQLPCLKDNSVYRDKVNDICQSLDDDERENKIIAFASNLIHDFFGTDSSMMGYRDRRCRVDFNTQISMPIAQRMMELLRTHRPSKLYSFEDLFSELKPADYLLKYFENHFGFKFEELSWRYDPVEVAEIVKSTMEPLMKQLALVLYKQHCDIIVLAGRPTSLDAITELFIKYVPTSPDRLVRLNEYHVGNWFPTADGQGYFYDQKSIVAVGGMVGYLASHNGLKGLVIDFNRMIKTMTSTANYVGEYNSHRQQVKKTLLTPSTANSTFKISVFPAFLGCRQLDSAIYQSRPLYAIYNKVNRGSLNVRLSRNYFDNREDIWVEDVTDSEGNTLPKDTIEIVQQSLVDDGKHWLDKGEFELTIR